MAIKHTQKFSIFYRQEVRWMIASHWYKVSSLTLLTSALQHFILNYFTLGLKKKNAAEKHSVLWWNSTVWAKFSRVMTGVKLSHVKAERATRRSQTVHIRPPIYILSVDCTQEMFYLYEVSTPCFYVTRQITMKLQYGIKFCHSVQGLHNTWDSIWLTFWMSLRYWDKGRVFY